MSASLKIVIDTNVLVSSLLSEQTAPGRAVQLALREHKVLLSTATSFEIQRVLNKNKLARLLSAKTRTEFVERLVRASTSIQVISSFAICRDPQDDKFLQLAIDGEADILVTGDADLLILNPFRGLRILTAHRFLEEFDAHKASES